MSLQDVMELGKQPAALAELLNEVPVLFAFVFGGFGGDGLRGFEGVSGWKVLPFCRFTRSSRCATRGVSRC